MKRLSYLLRACLLLFVSSSIFFSCTKEENETVTKTIKASFEIWMPSLMRMSSLSSKTVYLTANGETIGIDSVTLNKEGSSDGVYIKSVKYSFDEKKLSTINVAPYTFSYSIKNENVGEHKLSYVITYVAKDGNERTSNGEYDIVVMPESLKVDDALYIGNNTERVTDETDIALNRNETLSGHLELKDSNVNAKITKVEYYFDGKLISASGIEPYSFSCDLSSESVGKHKFTRMIYISCDYGETRVWRINEITIK